MRGGDTCYDALRDMNSKVAALRDLYPPLLFLANVGYLLVHSDAGGFEVVFFHLASEKYIVRAVFSGGHVDFLWEALPSV